MATSQELIEIWHFREQQEIRLIELDHRFRALLEILKTQPRLFDSYQNAYKIRGSSKVILEHEPAIRTIREKLQRLSDTSEIGDVEVASGRLSSKPSSDATSR